MKVALVQCPVWGTYDPPLALALLSACLKKEANEVFVFDINIGLYHNRNKKYKDMWAWEWSEFWYKAGNVSQFFADNQDYINNYISRILNTDARVICFSVSAASQMASLKLAEALKARRKGLIIVFGGPLFFDEKQINSILNGGAVDVVIPREGEITLCELVKIIKEDKDIGLCPGLFYKKDEQTKYSGISPLMKNLDALPFLDLTDLSPQNYDDNEHIALMASRGCVQGCVFCSSRTFWPGYRCMSGERIYQEIKYHSQQYDKLGHIDFLDLLFNGNMRALTTFCDLMINKPLRVPIKWSINAIIRPEMTPEVLNKMSDAGCEHIIYGIESGSQRILDLMQKYYNITDADRVIKATYEAGIMTTANFMFGFPGEAEEDFQLTLDFIKRNYKYLDRVYPSRTYCAVEEFSYLHRHQGEFGIKPNPPNHLYWESMDGKNTYPLRLKRCEEFSKLALSLGIEVGPGVQTSVELERWFNLGHYYESKQDYEQALAYFEKYYREDPDNKVISNKVKMYRDLLQKSIPVETASDVTN